MKTYKLKAEKREALGKKNSELRKNGLVPCVVYGPELKQNLYIQVDDMELKKINREAGESSIITLEIAGEKAPIEVLIKDKVVDPILMNITHVDFYKIKAGQKIEANIKLVFVGEAPVIKSMGGTLIEVLDELKVKCLPKDLIHEIKVDLSVLKTYDDTVYVKDLPVSAEVEVLNAPDDFVVSVTPPEKEEEVVAETEVTPEMPEVIGKKKEDEAVDGEEAKKE